MKNSKKAGVLCHISSLPGKYGIGTLGKEAYRFVKLLSQSGVKIWQILPLVQTGYGDSPYSSVSCFSGNPYFIDPDTLKAKGLLTSEECKQAELPAGRVDYGAVYHTRYPLLRKAYARFNIDDKDFRAFVKRGEAEDYAMFMTGKTVFEGRPFVEWEAPVRDRDPEALEAFRTRFHEEYLFWQFIQYEFTLEWKALKEYANENGIFIVGDIPLYVAYDSADVWANSRLFQLDEALRPVKVAGVPPDYFSAEGQLWGNPVYDWEKHAEEGYAWWKKRLEYALTVYDYVRIDHFRGLDRYYAIPAGAPNAIVGEWEDGPKEKLFEVLSAQSRRRIIAEDLGILDDGVVELLEKTGFPGMKVLLFAFDGNKENAFLPHNIEENSLCYTGTHDNDTVVGYLERISEGEITLLRSRIAEEAASIGWKLKVGKTEKELCYDFVQLALGSRSEIAVIPMQDLLALNNDYRMNYPGIGSGNWQFRMEEFPPHTVFARLKRYIKKADR